jgi:hypothetical protein
MSEGGGLDELFSSSLREEPVEEAPEPASKERSRALLILRNVLVVAAATVVTVAGVRSAGFRISVPLVVFFFIGLRLVIWAVAQVAPPPLPKRQAAGSASAQDAAIDALRVSVRRWERNLDRAHADPEVYTRNLLPVLAELTDERLRLRHGITRQSDPRRARELLGDPLWAALHDPGRRSARSRELESYVDTLERL